MLAQTHPANGNNFLDIAPVLQFILLLFIAFIECRFSQIPFSFFVQSTLFVGLA
jgi:hypothetical protein